MQCSNCGIELAPDATYCGNCGAQLVKTAAPAPQPVTNPGLVSPQVVQPATAAPTPAAPQPAPMPAAPAPAPAVSAAPLPQPQPVVATAAAPAANMSFAVPKTESTGLSIASLVTGILALVTCLIWLLALPLGIIAVVCGFVGKGKGGRGMAIAGIITGTLGILLTIAITAIAISTMEEQPQNQPGNEFRPQTSQTSWLLPYTIDIQPR